MELIDLLNWIAVVRNVTVLVTRLKSRSGLWILFTLLLRLILAAASSWL